MIDRDTILRVVETLLDGQGSGAEIGEGDLFLVDVQVRPGDEVEIVLDSDRTGGVGIDRCAAISRGVEQAIYAELGQGADFSLTVQSAGIGQPIRLRRQFERLVGMGAWVEVLYRTGLKQVGKIVGVGDLWIDITYQAKELLEGQKRKKVVEKVLLEDTKQIVEHLHS